MFTLHVQFHFGMKFQIEIKKQKKIVKLVEEYLLAIKVDRCRRMLDLVTFSCVGLGWFSDSEHF